MVANRNVARESPYGRCTVAYIQLKLSTGGAIARIDNHTFPDEWVDSDYGYSSHLGLVFD